MAIPSGHFYFYCQSCEKQTLFALDMSGNHRCLTCGKVVIERAKVRRNNTHKNRGK